MEPAASRRRRVLSESEKCAYVLRQAQSGKTPAAFCRDEGVALSSFQNWKKKFADKPAFVEIAATVHFVPVEVVLASGVKVVASSDCDPSWLAKLVRALGAPPC
jgi:hypothetical protein